MIAIAELLPLDLAERAIPLQCAGRVYEHVFRRITAADWAAYFASQAAERADEGRSRPQSGDHFETSLLLYERIILRSDGYKTRDGRKPEELPNWPNCIPFWHRVAAIDLLMKTSWTFATDSIVLEPDGTSVSFVLLNEGGSWAMKQLSGLIHHFRAPSGEQRRRFLRMLENLLADRSAVDRAGLPEWYTVPTSLYDELIVSAEGYSVNNRPIAPDELQREMDALHKLIAATKLFNATMDDGGGLEIGFGPFFPRGTGLGSAVANRIGAH